MGINSFNIKEEIFIFAPFLYVYKVKPSFRGVLFHTEVRFHLFMMYNCSSLTFIWKEYYSGYT
ncbi:MAG TPA: hypothetical protein DCM59_16060 [Clostridium sp.]|nr:hypothetical protein [Clostridium sp.]